MWNMLRARLASDQYILKTIQKIKDRSGKGKSLTALTLSSTALAACGGAGDPDLDPADTPTGVFTLANGNEFTGTNLADTLNQGGQSVPLIVFGLGGDDVVFTGTGNDIIDGGAGNDTINAAEGADILIGGAGNDTLNGHEGNDMFRGGLGVDTINGGDGHDIIIVVGTTTATQYTNASITNPAGSGTDLSNLITLADLNGQTVSEAAPGEVINGGGGNNTLYVYGTVDFTDVTLTNVTQVVVNSDVTFTKEQLGNGVITKITGDGGSVIRIESKGGNTVTVDLTEIDMTGVSHLDVGANVTVVTGSSADLKGAGITVVSGEGVIELTLPDAASDMAGLAIENALTVKDNNGATVEHSDTGAIVLTPAETKIHIGTSGDDTLTGNSENNVLNGKAGDDTINGGEGNDIIISGSGADILVFDAGWGQDKVSDFEDDIDKIDLSSTNLTFDDLVITVVDGNTVIEDGDGNTITLNDIASGIDANDFIF